MIRDCDKTRIYCPVCGTFHSASLAERDGRVFWRKDCPKGACDVRISSDAALFRELRTQARPIPEWYRRSLSNCILHINDDCSLHCPICFENAGRTGWRMSMDEVRKAADKIAARHPVNVMLMGGEPTEHPEIFDILRLLSREYHFRCSMLTNGYRLGAEPDFAAKIKAAGLSKASISFDTFDENVSVTMRGRGDLVGIKLKAVEKCIAAGLQCGFVTTASQLNLHEIPKIVSFVVEHAQWMPMYEIQCYQEAGRIVPGLKSVDREEVIKEIVNAGVIPGLTTAEFRVSPSVPAAGYCISPDCGAGLFWVVRNGVAEPLTRRYDFDGFCEKLSQMKPSSRNLKWLKFFWLGVKHFGLEFIGLMRGWTGRSVRKDGNLQLLSISSLMNPEKLECHRFGHCTNGVLTADGKFQSPCFYYCLTFDRERRLRT